MGSRELYQFVVLDRKHARPQGFVRSCPSCKGKEIVIDRMCPDFEKRDEDFWPWYYFARCDTCGFTSGLSAWIGEAVTLWNRRENPVTDVVVRGPMDPEKYRRVMATIMNEFDIAVLDGSYPVAALVINRAVGGENGDNQV